MSILLEFLTSLLKLARVTSSPVAPENAVDSTSTLKSGKESESHLLRIKRNPAKETTDALFGDMDYNDSRICFTMERTAVAIPVGTYSGAKRYSPHAGRQVVGIDVPNRTDIEIHPANFPCQLKGCIAAGESIDGDALDNSTQAFDAMMLAVPDSFLVQVC